jgi:hypothetical protein
LLDNAYCPHVFSGIEVPRVNYEKLSSDRLGEPSEAIRARVQAARDIVPNDLLGSASENGSGGKILNP